VPFYQRLGDVPRKRHIQFRENGTLLTEEVMGLEGFTGNESILYHLQSPCRVQELGLRHRPVRPERVLPRLAERPAAVGQRERTVLDAAQRARLPARSPRIVEEIRARP
jgi:hypothetical protein